MTTILTKCPNCKTQFKIPNAEEKEGKKVLCKKCNAPFRIHVPKSTSSDDSDSDELGSGDDFGSGSFEADTDLPPALPAPRKKKLAQKKAMAKELEEAEAKRLAAAKAKAPKGPKSKVGIIVAVVVVVVFVGVAVGGAFLIKHVGGPQKYTAPTDEDYVDFKPLTQPLAAKISKQWKKESGGGIGGKPVWARFSDGTIWIEVRQIRSAGMIGQAVKNMQKGKDAMAVGDASPAEKLDKEFSDSLAKIYSDYNEQPVRDIMTGFGPGRIADFTAKEGLLRSSIAGCRATARNEEWEVNVTCTCKPAVFQDAKPVFEKLVSSLNDGSDK